MERGTSQSQQSVPPDTASFIDADEVESPLERSSSFLPASAPSSPSWRRKRFLSSDIDPMADSSTPLNQSQAASYGTLPAVRGRDHKRLGRGRVGIPPIRSLGLGGVGSSSQPGTPGTSPSRIRPISFFGRRPLSTYDQPLGPSIGGEEGDDEGARVNGIRVWYSSFTSIDWLHDAIKDSARMLRLRRRRSLRGRIRNLLDRFQGWVIVTIVGFLTAVIAFLIVRSEQLFFDLKEGYCSKGWWHAKRFCCAHLDHGEACPVWRTWADVFGPKDSNGERIGTKSWVIEYVSYTVIALSLASASSLLTLYLTASTSFTTRKDPLISREAASDGKSNPVVAPPPRKVLYFAAGSGIPEIKTILSGFVMHGYLGGRTLFTKSVGLALSVASGLSLGKEGPFVHIASCVGNIVSRYWLKYETNEGKRREILSAACAAGVAVAFGAPVGGVLFSLEEVSYFFPPKVMWRSFFCAMIAALTLKFLDPFGTGKLVLFEVTYDKDWYAYELFFFLILGIFGGLYGAYFSKLNYRWSKHVRNGTWLKAHPVIEVLLVTLVTTLVCFLNPYTRMGGTELVYNLFAECRPGDWHEGLCISEPSHARPVINAIGVALLAKGLLTIVTFGIKLPAGIFIPTLGVGACFGRILGIAVEYLQYKHPEWKVFEVCGNDGPCVIPGVYAMVGAAATLSGVTRTTVSLAVIMFELTGTLTYVGPVMLAVLVAKTVADAIEPKGIYDLVIELSELPYLDDKHEYLWGALQVSDVTDRKVDVIRADRDNTVQSLRQQLHTAISMGYTDGGFPILTKEEGGMKMMGYIGINELEHALSVVADSPTAVCHFHPMHSVPHDYAASTISSLYDTPMEPDPFDFTGYMDQAPLTVQSHSPLELVQQLFVKLGARYVIVTNSDGFYEGIIDKNGWLAFLGELEKKKG